MREQGNKICYSPIASYKELYTKKQHLNIFISLYLTNMVPVSRKTAAAEYIFRKWLYSPSHVYFQALTTLLSRKMTMRSPHESGWTFLTASTEGVRLHDFGDKLIKGDTEPGSIWFKGD